MQRKFVGLVAVAAFLVFTAAFHKPRKTHPYRFAQLGFFPQMPVAGGNPVTEEGVLLGRHLFYDPILSADSTLSCASCHRQSAAFSDAPNRFSSDRFGKPLPRNTPPLFNLAWYPQLFWDGRASDLETQVFHPLTAHKEMNLQLNAAVVRLKRSDRYRRLFFEAFGSPLIDSSRMAKAIAQFERTLISYRSKYDRVLAGTDQFSPEEFAGFEIANDMSMGDCLHCHSTDNDALGVIPAFSNNGLDGIANPDSFPDKGFGVVTGNREDLGKFKVPTMRNVALTAPYMHDGRFNTLEEVVRFYSEGVRMSANIDSKMGSAHQGGVRLSVEQQKALVAFLKTLSDSAFISDPAFSNPFTEKSKK